MDYDLEDAAQDESTSEASSSPQHSQRHSALPASAGLVHAVYKNYNVRAKKHIMPVGKFIASALLCISIFKHRHSYHHLYNRLQPFFRDHPGEPVPEENFWTLWCKGRLTKADTPTIRLGTTPSGLTSAQLRQPPSLFTGRMPFLTPNQQCQSTEGNTSAF